jgi:hypothetical protein
MERLAQFCPILAIVHSPKDICAPSWKRAQGVSTRSRPRLWFAKPNTVH